MTTPPPVPAPLLAPPLPDPWTWAWIGEKLWDMPGGIGALIGALIGFGALIYVTNKGFKNLIAAQKHKAGLDRELAAEALQSERDSIYTAIAADLDALQRALTRLRDKLVAVNLGVVTMSALLTNRHIIWESCAPKIGLLNPSHAAIITETYRYIDGLTGKIADVDLSIEENQNTFLPLIDAAIKRLDTVLKCLPVKPYKPNGDPR